MAGEKSTSPASSMTPDGEPAVEMVGALAQAQLPLFGDGLPDLPLPPTSPSILPERT